MSGLRAEEGTDDVTDLTAIDRTATAPTTPAARSGNAGVSAATRSRVTNGSVLLAGIDGRTSEARRHRDLVDDLAAAYDATGEADMLLVRRLAALATWCEGEEAKLARGEAADVAALITCSNSIRRLRNDLAKSARAKRRSARAGL